MASLPISFKFGGVAQIERTLFKLRRNIGDLRPVWDQVHDYFLQVEEELFESGGASGAQGRWPGYESEPRYAAMKARVVGPSYGRVLLWGSMATSRLGPSLTQDGHPNHVYQADAKRMETGTNLAYADRLAQGGPTAYGETAPPRFAVDLHPRQVREIVRIVQRGIMRGVGQGGEA